MFRPALTFFAPAADKELYRCLPPIGIVLVFAAVFGGYVLEHGNPWVLMQPAELLIIGGAAVGIILVSNPWVVIRNMVAGAIASFRPPAHNTQDISAEPSNAV